VTNHGAATDLLAAIPRVLDGVGVQLLDADGQAAATFGSIAPGATAVRVELPAGALVAAVPPHAAFGLELVSTLLNVLADRERLAGDMDSMNQSSLRLLEQVSMYGETLPRLSAGGDDAEIAALGAGACQRAASVEQVLYLALVPDRDCLEVVVHLGADGRPVELAATELSPSLPVAGFLADVLAAEEGVVLRSVDGQRLGDPGSPEHLAAQQILGVPVAYGAGEQRVRLGVLLLIDKRTFMSRQGVAAAAARLDSEDGLLAESFAAMLGAVLGARKTAALGKELSMAKAIQRQILPEKPIELAGYDVAAGYYACGAVGGDYFDYVPLADGRTLAVVADVSGHNLASGMIMVGARSMLRTLASVLGSPAAVLQGLAERMFDDLTRTERFLTAAAVALRAGDGAIELVSAGHNDTLVYRAASGTVEAIASDSTILGFLPRPQYVARPLHLHPGDCVLLFTDGITEATGAGDEMFGQERLMARFAALAARHTAREIVDGLVAAVDAFRGGQGVGDDVTAVVIRYHGKAFAGAATGTQA
jgi:serine phosphatase RsbU (regulator of sigma subunit)